MSEFREFRPLNCRIPARLAIFAPRRAEAELMSKKSGARAPAGWRVTRTGNTGGRTQALQIERYIFHAIPLCITSSTCYASILTSPNRLADGPCGNLCIDPALWALPEYRAVWIAPHPPYFSTFARASETAPVFNPSKQSAQVCSIARRWVAY
jgi:hypothetical protein